MFSVIIPAGRAENLIPCLAALTKCEPALPLNKIIVVEDGIREQAEPHVPAVTWLAGIKPFVFARNVNIGINAAGTDDVILLNDDGQLLTPGGFTKLAAIGQEYGVTSAAIRGDVGNLRQMPQTADAVRLEPERTVAFVCVFIPRPVLDSVGLLDERFVTYGWDDNDYCKRVRDAGLKLAIYDGCVVDHASLPSVFRRIRQAGDVKPGRKIYRQKWGMVD